MAYSTRSKRYQPQDSSRAICGAATGLAVCWFLVDFWSISRETGAATSGERVQGLMALAGLAMAAGVFVQAGAALLLAVGRSIPGRSDRRRSFLVAVPIAAVFFLFTAPRFVDLLSGDWISQQAWRPALLVVLLFGSGSAYLYAGIRMTRLVLQHGRIPWYAGIGFLVGAVFCFVVDGHASLARKYEAAHDILAAFGLAAAALGGASLFAGPWRRLALPQLLIGLVVVALTAFQLLPGESEYMRRTLLKSSRLASRVLGNWVAPPEPDTDIDSDLLAELTRTRALDAALLDQKIPGRRSHDVVLITIDTLRYDLVQPGEDDRVMPHLSRHLREGVVFKSAWSQFPSSRLAMHAMFTGRYPTAGEVYRSDGRFPSPEPASQTLAETLGNSGFVTHALTSFQEDFYAREKHHLVHGFEHVINDAGDPLEASERVVARAIEALGDDRTDGPPAFVWVHLFDPHEPYRIREGVPADADRRERYEGEVRHTDRCLERLLTFLKSSKKQRVVVLHSDHGEEFRDHGGFGHHSSLYEEQVHVPFVISGPGFAARSIDRPVELIDLPATLCELTGAEPLAQDRGHSLVPILLGLSDSTWPAPYAFSQFREPRFVHGDLDAVRDDRWKLVHDRRLGFYELYDMAADPYERVNLAPSHPEVLEHMRRVLTTMRAYAGLESVPEASHGRDLLRRAAQGPLDDKDFEQYRRLLRRPRLPDPGVLPDLLSHGDEEIRRAALIHAATHADGLARAELSRRVLEEGGRPAAEAALALALLGDEESAEGFEELSESLVGDERLMLYTARYLAGDLRYGTAVHQLIADPNNDRDIDTLVMYALMRVRDPWLLPALYARMNLGMRHAEHRMMALEAATRMSFDVASPLVRRFLNHPDRAMREAIESFLAADPALADWRRQALKAEAAADKARALGVDPEQFERAGQLYLEALQAMAEVGVFDWGYVLELSFLWCVQGRRADLSDILSPHMPDAASSRNTFALELARRFMMVSQTAELPVRAELRLLPGSQPLPGEAGRVNLLVEIRAGASGSGLVGGIGTKTEYLGAVLLDQRGRPSGETASLPLPLTGVVPGETMVLAVPLLIPENAPGALKVGIRLGRADTALVPPLTLSIRR